MAYAINAALKNVGTTLMVREFPRNPRTNSILQLAAEIDAGRIKQLFIFGGDPVYNAPRGLAEDPRDEAVAELGRPAEEGAGRGARRLLRRRDFGAEQMARAAAHYLESWGDALTSEGGYVAIQPMILPLFGGVSEIEVLNGLLGGPKLEGPELVQETFRATAPPGDFNAAWSQSSARRLRHARAAARSSRRRSTRTPPAAWRTTSGLAPPAPTPDSPEIVLVRSYSVDDGRYINNGWLQEMPDPVTKLTWDNAALMSPALREASQASKTGDMIEITVTETMLDAQAGRTQARRSRAMVMPGHADNSITIPLGYGRKNDRPSVRRAKESAAASTPTSSARARIRISSPRTARR